MPRARSDAGVGEGMRRLLTEHAALQARPIAELSVPEARMQASLADAANALRWRMRIPAAPEIKMKTRDLVLPTQVGNLAARVYTPAGRGPFPIILFFHGGGWVVGDINAYDAAPRALAIGAGAVAISVEYRQAPEHKFPAAHEDAWAAYIWTIRNAQRLNGDAARIVVAGENAGGNLAANVALRAKQFETVAPIYQLLIYPLVGIDTNTASYRDFGNALPLGRDDLAWLFGNVFASANHMADARINLVGRNDLSGLPAATVVLAEIDPLRSEGEAYARNMASAGVPVRTRIFPGVTHEFFGMGKVLPEAKQAMEEAVEDLKVAFATK